MLNFNINPCTKAILCVTIPSCMPVIKSAIKKVENAKGKVEVEIVAEEKSSEVKKE